MISEHGRTELERGLPHRDERRSAMGSHAYDSALADPIATDLELRLDEREHVIPLGETPDHAFQHRQSFQ